MRRLGLLGCLLFIHTYTIAQKRLCLQYLQVWRIFVTMIKHNERANLLSDWDGTAVETVSKFDPRNWVKMGMPFKPGYVDFLRGTSDGGLSVDGVVSRRGSLRRGVATWLTIENAKRHDVGLNRYISWGGVTLAGSESNKAEHVVARAKHLGKLVLIDDKPQTIGQELIMAMKRHSVTRSSGYLDITIGAVAHDKSERYMDEFLQDRLTPHARKEDDGITTFHIGKSATLRVLSLEPYSYEAGLQLAQQINAIPLTA